MFQHEKYSVSSDKKRESDALLFLSYVDDAAIEWTNLCSCVRVRACVRACIFAIVGFFYRNSCQTEDACN